MPLYVGDYLRDTRRLSTIEHGSYLLLIMEYWLHGSLPSDDAQLARIAMLSDKQWAKVRPSLAPFFTEGWTHGRIERELAKAAEKNTRRVEAGKAGGYAKHRGGKKGSNATGNATSNALASSSQPQSEDTSLRSVSPEQAPRKPKSVRSRIDENAQPTDADRAHASTIGMSTEAFRFEWSRFRDHHLKCASLMANWPAAWRTWCANWVERGSRSRAGPSGSPRGRTVAEMAAMNLDDDGYHDPRPDPRDSPAQGANGSDQGRSGFVGRLPFEDPASPRRGPVVDH